VQHFSFVVSWAWVYLEYMFRHGSVQGVPFPVLRVWFGCGSVPGVPFPVLGVLFSSIVVEIWGSHSFLSAFSLLISGLSLSIMPSLQPSDLLCYLAAPGRPWFNESVGSK
jgi:hypothetical protein